MSRRLSAARAQSSLRRGGQMRVPPLVEGHRAHAWALRARKGDARGLLRWLQAAADALVGKVEEAKRALPSASALLADIRCGPHDAHSATRPS